MNKYDKAWKKIDSLIGKDGLLSSALAEVNKVYALAKTEKKDAQLIKALIYKMSLQEMKEEESAEKNIQQLEKELALTPEPAKSIINSLLAELYWNYFQQQRYRLYDRTETVDFKKADISTWGVEDLHKKISQLFLASLKNQKQLQQTKLEPYDAIILKGNVRQLRPTLFDLLAHRALNYFRNEERDLTKPAYEFLIDKASAFDPAADFITRKFPTKDSLSLHHKALLLYQRLIAFHINDTKPDALIDVDLDRLQFVLQHATINNKQDLYEMALNHIGHQYENHPAAAQAWFLLAQSYYNQGDINDSSTGYKKAKEILDRILAQKDSSEGKINAQLLMKQLTAVQLSFNIEKVNLPGQPFRILLNYRNTNAVHFRVIALTPSIKAQIAKNNNWEDAYWQSVVKLSAVRTFTQSLPDDKDYREHSVESKVDSLPIGEYALLSSADKDFSTKENQLALQFFHISAIAYLNNANNYYVVHRETGKPLPRANVQVWYRFYDANTRKYQDRKGENMVTDKDGHFSIAPSQTNTNNSYKLEITTTGDRLFMDETSYNSNSRGEDLSVPNRSLGFLFTDRAIYRPGQIVHFKGLMVTKNEKTGETKIEAGKKTTAYLIDVNNEKIDSLSLVSGEFGSYSGRFTLPLNRVNGNFRIDAGNGNINFSVEEYKRPKFSVEIVKPSGSYRVNDSIMVKGTARAYAGNTINGAAVKYRVVRKTRWPIWFDYMPRGRKIWPPYSREEQEIAYGNVTTDADGGFTIPFKAIPDASVNKKDQPTFYYEVSADITDINGETRSGKIEVAVAYQALQLSINTPGELPADSLKKLSIRSTNINDIFEKATVTVTVHKLKQPTRIFRARYWQQPDRFIMNEEEYHRLFPHDIYKDENLVANWPKERKVLELTDTTDENGNFNIPNQKFESGWYIIEVNTKDKYGEPVKAIKTFQLTGQANTNPIAFGSVNSIKEIYEPGETGAYVIKTNLDSVWAIHTINRNSKKEEQRFINLSAESKNFSVPVTDADRGNIALSISFVKYNRFFSDNSTLIVPYTNKELTISYETFRDKTLPGSAEKWKVKIAGYKKDKIMAELLTAMYDASLDQFAPQQWSVPGLWNNRIYPSIWNSDRGFQGDMSLQKQFGQDQYSIFEKNYDRLLSSSGMSDGRPGASARRTTRVRLAGAVSSQMAERDGSGKMKKEFAEESVAGNWTRDALEETAQALDSTSSASKNNDTQNPAVQIRRNFNETAFFFPDLKTDSAGNIEFSFTMPEALTQWKWMSLAHTKDLAFGYSEKTIVTQKDLMVQPNAPRFFREGDRMDFTTKIVNLTDKELTGQVELQLIDPTNNQPVDGWFRNFFPNQYFTVPAKQSVPASFTIEIPFQYNKAVSYRVIARSGNISDGEEMMLPVLTNRTLVTESLPLNMRGTNSKQFRFEKLLKSGESETLNHQALTVEYTSNPAWYAVQALPYLMEYPYDCSEQTFNRFYANALASSIVNSSPRIKTVFEKWKTTDTSALLSNLQKNQELKSVLLQETPWVLEGKSESQQKKNIALLFDMVRMSAETASNLDKLAAMQLSNGGFSWFNGGPDDRYMTQYILTGIGHLKKLNALPKNNEKLQSIIAKGLSYLDKRIKEDYDKLIKDKANLATVQPGSYEIQYLYMRSFFTETNVPGETFKAYNFYRKLSQQSWVKQSKYMQGMIALGLFRTGDVQTSKNIIKSLQQNSLRSEEMGMYWKEFNTGGYYWYQAPIESHALLTEAFAEITKDNKITADLKTWLLKQKQTQNWRTTKATADACYVLLLEGTDWLREEPVVTITAGPIQFSSTSGTEAGTGYFKKVVDGTKVKPEMGNISVTVTGNSNQSSSWGSVYWQYFEELDKITPSATPVKLVKKLFVEKNSDRGPILQPIKEGDAIKVGDKIKVRIELRSDRMLEYVHMKDMRAASLEPVNVISAYKWQGGLGYYESTKDASTSFFFHNLPKGTWIFEYSLFVTHTGTFSNGITTVECMYAPEFRSNSEGIKISVE